MLPARQRQAIENVRTALEPILPQAPVHEIYQQLCELLVTEAGFRMAWVGIPEDDSNKSIRPVAVAGHDDGYVESLQLSWGDTPRGKGPTGIAVRTGAPSMNWDWSRTSEPHLRPWREDALRRGYASSFAVPLVSKKSTFAVVTCYSGDAGGCRDLDAIVSFLGGLAQHLARKDGTE